jgi:hypothetical protein
MRTLNILRRIFTSRIAPALHRRRSTFTCGQCERWERCGLPPHEDCVVRAAQLARGARPIKRLGLPAC